MKSFNFNLSEETTKKLSDIHENYIKLRHISSDNFDNLEQQFIIRTTYPDNSVVSNILSCGAFISVYTREPKLDIEYPIEDCPYTTIEAVKKDFNAKYIFQYETLEDILKNATEKEKETKIKVEQEVNEWIEKVDKLFDTTADWIKQYERNIKITKSKSLIREEISGAYDVSFLEIVIFNKLTIRFEPIGTFVLGGKGRIDIKTNFRPFDSYMLVLQPIGGIEKWFLIKNRDNSSKKEFSQSQLLILIENAIKTKDN